MKFVNCAGDATDRGSGRKGDILVLDILSEAAPPFITARRTRFAAV